MTVDADTLKWWERQSPEARQVLADAENPNVASSLTEALTFLSEFIPHKSVVWTNGANFDQPLLAVAYAKCGVKLPWDYWNGRCHRTVLSLHPNAKSLAPVNANAHNALEDAITQAKHLTIVSQALKLKL